MGMERETQTEHGGRNREKKNMRVEIEERIGERERHTKDGWLIGFNGISTSIGYLMPKPVYTYVRYEREREREN